MASSSPFRAASLAVGEPSVPITILRYAFGAVAPDASAPVVSTISRSESAKCAARSGTLPSRNLFALPMPLFPTTMRSAPSRCATCRMMSAGSPRWIHVAASTRSALAASFAEASASAPRSSVMAGGSNAVTITSSARSRLASRAAAACAMTAESEPSVPITIFRYPILAPRRLGPAARHQRAVHLRMDVAPEEVRTGREGSDVVHDLLRPLDELAPEQQLRRRGIRVDGHVVLDAAVLIVEGEVERAGRRGMEGLGVECDPLRHDLDRRASGRGRGLGPPEPQGRLEQHEVQDQAEGDHADAHDRAGRARPKDRVELLLRHRLRAPRFRPGDDPDPAVVRPGHADHGHRGDHQDRDGRPDPALPPPVAQEPRHYPRAHPDAQRD